MNSLMNKLDQLAYTYVTFVLKLIAVIVVTAAAVGLVHIIWRVLH